METTSGNAPDQGAAPTDDTGSLPPVDSPPKIHRHAPNDDTGIDIADAAANEPSEVLAAAYVGDVDETERTDELDAPTDSLVGAASDSTITGGNGGHKDNDDSDVYAHCDAMMEKFSMLTEKATQEMHAAVTPTTADSPVSLPSSLDNARVQKSKSSSSASSGTDITKAKHVASSKIASSASLPRVATLPRTPSPPKKHQQPIKSHNKHSALQASHATTTTPAHGRSTGTSSGDSGSGSSVGVPVPVPVPHYALPKDTSTNSPSSKEARDLHECSKKFRALPLPSIKAIMSPRQYFKPKVVNSATTATATSTAMSSSQSPRLRRSKTNDSFKARPMPDFKAAHARANVVVRSDKPLTRPIPFQFLTEQRMQAKKRGQQGTAFGTTLSSMLSTSSLGLVKSLTSSQGKDRTTTAGNQRPLSNRRKKPAQTTNGKSASSARFAPKVSPIQESVGEVGVAVSAAASEITNNELEQNIQTGRIEEDVDQAELDLLLTDGDEGEVTFESGDYDEEADAALDELLDDDAPDELDAPVKAMDGSAMYESPAKLHSMEATHQRSPDDVQTMNLDHPKDKMAAADTSAMMEPTALEENF